MPDVTPASTAPRSSFGKKRYLVTGGLGYAGTWISAHLAAQGHEVHVVTKGDRDISGHPAHSVVFADLAKLSPEELADALPEQLDGVVHASSQSADFEPDFARHSLLVNAFGTRTLLQALVEQAGRQATQLPLVVCLSTWHVYGKTEGSIDEQTPVQPKCDYSVTHLFAEEYCRMFMRNHGLPSIIARLGNCYGAPKAPGKAKWRLLLNDLCRKAHMDRRICLQADPSTMRDFVWFGDVAHSMELLLARRDLAGSVFNVTSGEALSTGSIAAQVAQSASAYYGVHIPLELQHEARASFESRCEAAGTAAQARLRVSNAAICDATGMRFAHHIDQEVVAILRYLEEQP